jgi:cytochrome b
MNKNYVWGPLVRLFHWTLVAAFVVSYTTGEEESLVHTYSGYLILGLILTRIIWGFIGTRHARFSDFLYSPAEVVRYLRDLFSNKPDIKRYLGHSPAGGMMAFALLISLLMTIYSGLKLEALEGRGLLAQSSVVQVLESNPLVSAAQADERENEHKNGYPHDDDDDEHEGEGEGEDFWEELHEFFANFTLLLVILHVSGVVFSSLRHKENLVRAMFTGYKK